MNNKSFPCYYLNGLFNVNSEHDLPDISSIIGHYEFENQFFDIYKSGNSYMASIDGDSHVSTVEPIFYYYVSSDGKVSGPAFSIGFQINAYMMPIYDNSGNVISLKCIDLTDPKDEHEELHGYITEGNEFARSCVSINEIFHSDIYEAVDAAKNNDTILLLGSHKLSKPLIIDKEITLKGIIGDKENLTTITGFQGSLTANPVINIIIKNAVTLDSIWIDIDSSAIGANGDNLNGMRGVIDLGDSVNAKVINCKFTKATSSEANDQSTAVYAGSGSLIENNYFKGWIKAIYSENNNNPATTIIKNNIFENNIYGIQIALTPNYQIINNVISDSSVSISGENVEFNNNQFHNVILKVHSSSVTISNNAFMGISEVINKKPAVGPIDVSGNYWEGTPEISGNLKLDNWYRSYNSESDTPFSDLVNEEIIGIIYVNGSVDTSGNGTEDAPFKTISEAIEVINSSQTIFVLPGTYDETILISESLNNVTLLGANSNNNPLDGSWDQNGTILTKGVHIETRGTHEDPNPNIVDGLTIKGFDFKNEGFVVVEWWENGSISNIIIENNRFTDIDNGSNIDDESNINDKSNGAIHFNLSESMPVNNLTIKYNFIQNIGSNQADPSGIYISSAKGTVLIEGNYIKNTNHSSIQVFNQASGELIIQNNHLENWDFDTFNGGRAFRFDNISIDKITIRLNSIIQKSDFNGEDLPDMYLKITGSNTHILASENYWDGKDPKVEGFPIYAEDKYTVEIHSWYTQYDPETNTLSGLVDDDVPGVTPDVPDVPSIPDIPDVPTTPEVPTPDENGDVSVEIPKTDIDKIVDDAVSSGSSSVTITDVSDVENVSSVTISKNDLQNVLDKLESEDSISEAVVTLPEGSVSIGKDVLSSILETSGEESITIKVSDAKNELNEEQQKIVGDRPVYNVTMMSGSEKITSFDGKTITISIPYELKENEDPDNIVVYYVKDDGTIEKMNCTYRDGKVSFETDHLSYFAISYEVPEPVTEKPADNNNTIYYVIAAVVVLLAIIAAAYFITKRKQ